MHSSHFEEANPLFEVKFEHKIELKMKNSCTFANNFKHFMVILCQLLTLTGYPENQ